MALCVMLGVLYMKDFGGTILAKATVRSNIHPLENCIFFVLRVRCIR